MASVAVYREGKFSHFLKFKKAITKVATGKWRFRDDECTELEEITAEVQPCRQIFHDAPRGARFEWEPRPSGAQRIRVWQAKMSLSR